ncbi:tripartite tricarboxylate transporter substrate binding protein [Rhodoplanes sp. TEM]|uniref:Tripartite tricarboxylate transporter substrate binding protein n=1 Tax=Rhodoplanes tepidamans TaxID=200616 RepID=A0ABT5JCS0_RHOTP|nr:MULTISPECIES: tripartite tricarboxylate transporter substrate binding protein [Rhodoplanes]MDC7787495.1 tripartite tricarboxylate transporter substrate binding protein [Rhodoplanes tepidamans]MDC7983914.1 tripartite tricarboxylate transporter substrate binding protein [Rhodoplanes sp. TEM]MDQ0354353.1 tripartite-type tricarboxylate transporter receptor subunit TctC [Rhodoplanes tepidamans]
MSVLRTVALALAAALLAIPAARAQAPAPAAEYPARQVTLVVPYAAGGFADIRARKIAEKLGKALNATIIIDNKTGAGGVLGTAVIAKAPADGSVIGMGNLAPLAVNVSLLGKLPYDPATDVVPVILIERSPLVLSSAPGLGMKSVADVIARAKAEPGKITYGSSGVGGAHHLSGVMFGRQAGIDIVHVPYKGGGNAATDLLAGHISMMFEMGYAALPSIEAGKITPLAVTSSHRVSLLPNVPTMAEAGLPGFESYNWQGIIAPKGTPPAIVARLNAELNTILQTPDVRDSIVSQASEPAGGTPEEFAAFVKAETAKWAELIRAANVKPE